MRLAFIGVRGIPVVYSGFETFAEELSSRLVKRGHKVTVYCRGQYVDKSKKIFKGVDLVVLPSLKSKNLETFTHSFFATFHACFFGKFDAIFYIGVGSTIFSFLPRFLGIKTAVNVDGLDWKREKWGAFARTYLGLSEYLAVLIPNEVVTDSPFIKRYYRKKFRKNTPVIPYGYFEENLDGRTFLQEYGLEKGKYLTWVGRLVPDNHLDELISAFKKNKSDIKLVVIGDDFTGGNYKKRVKNLASNDKRIIFTGFIKRKKCLTLVKYSLAYVETKRSGGTHPSLVEAMGLGSLILSNDHPAHKFTLGNTATYYSLKNLNKDLTKKLGEIMRPRFKDKAVRLKSLTKKRAREYFSWKKITDDYEKLFKSLVLQPSQ